MEQSCLGTGDVVHHVFSLVCSTPDCHHTAVVTVGHLHQQKAKSETGKGSLAPPVALHSLAGVPAPVRKYLVMQPFPLHNWLGGHRQGYYRQQ